MGDFLDFGRDEPKQPEKPKEPEFVYNPPPVSSLYDTYRATGQVPYSYYGVGAPTREGELELVRKSYPGAFSSTPTPTPTPAPQQPRRNPFEGLGPFGALFGIPFSIFGGALGDKNPFKDFDLFGDN